MPSPGLNGCTPAPAGTTRPSAPASSSLRASASSAIAAGTSPCGRVTSSSWAAGSSSLKWPGPPSRSSSSGARSASSKPAGSSRKTSSSIPTVKGAGESKVARSSSASMRLVTLSRGPALASTPMRILDEQVERYLEGLRPERSGPMAEMEELADRDGIPIVHWEAGRFLATLCRALDPVVLEVGTAIGYSTLHMAEQLSEGRVVTLERDPERAARARDFLERAGVADRVELVEGDALETLPALDGPFDLLFVDASKGEYQRYIELADPKLDRARACSWWTTS